MATVKIQTEPCQGNPTGVVIIEEADYDPAKHKLVVDESKTDTPAPATETVGSTTEPASTVTWGKKRRG